MRAGPDAAERDAVLRQRAVHAASDRRRASHRPVDGAARAARRAGRDDRRRRHAACTCSRRISACASASGDSRCGRSSTISIRCATRLFVVLGDFNDWLPGRSVVHVLDDRLGRPPRPASFPVPGRSWRSIASGCTRALRCGGSPPTRRQPPGSPRITFRSSRTSKRAEGRRLAQRRIHRAL